MAGLPKDARETLRGYQPVEKRSFARFLDGGGGGVWSRSREGRRRLKVDWGRSSRFQGWFWQFVLSDDNGDRHTFYFESFSNRYDVLTLGRYLRPARKRVAT